MSSIHAKQVAIAKRILETKDEGILETVSDVLDGVSELTFTKKDVQEFERRLKEVESGAVKTIPWSTVRKRLAKKYGVK